MKIGILTYHRAENYGALLQAYALKEYLYTKGYDVAFVDYWPQYHIEHYKLFSWKKFCSGSYKYKIYSLYVFLIWGSFKFLRKVRLNRFMKQYLGLSRKVEYTSDMNQVKKFDYVIYGSDQIWRKQNDISNVGYNWWYFGSNNIIASRKIAYAGSMGAIDVDEQEKVALKNHFKNFDFLSVREKDLQLFLNTLGYDSQIVSDPVFLLSKEQWRSLKKEDLSERNRYILFYNLFNKKESEILVSNIQEKTGLSVKEINMKLDFHHVGKRYIKCASIETFLKLIDEAEYVISNSFHGIAFSIIFEKQFYAVGMGNKASRVLSLLQIAGIEDRYVDVNSLVDLENTIDYSVVRKNMMKLIESSQMYLINALHWDEE